MAEGKKSFTAYCDWIEIFEELTDEEAGKLVKHLLRYVNDLNPEEPDRVTKLTFTPIKNTLKRDLKKWEEKREKNRENALKRWDKKNTNAFERKKNDANNSVSDSVMVSDSDKVSVSNKLDNNTIPPKGEKHKIDFNKLLDFIKEKTNRNFKVINEKVKRKYKSRLKDGYTSKDIANAIINACNSKHHKDNNYQYLTPEFFSRSDTLDKYGFETKEQNKNKISVDNFCGNPYKQD